MKERSYILDSILLTKGDKNVDIRELMEHAVLFEDIYSNTMSGTITLNDAIGLIETFPIVGEEYLTFKFKSNFAKENFEKTFRVRAVESVVPSSSTRTQAYQLKLVSDFFVEDYNIRLRRIYKGKVSDIVTEIVTSLGYDIAEAEGTRNKISIVVPNWSPIQTINRLIDIAVSQNGYASYLFFEDRDGFRFVTIDSLTSGDVKANLFNSVLNYDTGIINPLNVSNYQVVNAFDVAYNAASGMFGAHSVSYDIINKKIEKEVVTYDKLFSESNPLDTKPVLAKGSPNNHFHFRSSNYLNRDSGYVAARRIPRHSHFDRYKIVADIQSWTDLKLGDVIYFDAESKASNSQSSDKYLNGKYLVTKIKHSLTIESHLMTLDLRRDSLEGKA